MVINTATKATHIIAFPSAEKRKKLQQRQAAKLVQNFLLDREQIKLSLADVLNPLRAPFVLGAWERFLIRVDLIRRLRDGGSVVMAERIAALVTLHENIVSAEPLPSNCDELLEFVDHRMHHILEIKKRARKRRPRPC